ncbi:glycosyltransferase family 61 protein [Plastoroseomonas arctica]|uniref:Glycosyltransferase family 61 protein n=1 Tax=Plastoroseomonas arctica TaxID=1509237 RepID=A0AAF1JW34_9PROT|nr:glycosyltransferase 61 family protein [Plastoroseomonas arctica]MBR0654874.1 glycosyltransferase family 61 protein [Plastoroseomonas arctica]
MSAPPSRIVSLALGRTAIGAHEVERLAPDTLLTMLRPGTEQRPPLWVNREDESFEALRVDQTLRPSAIALLEDVTIHPGRYLIAGDAYVLESLNNSILDGAMDLSAETLPSEALLDSHRAEALEQPRALPDAERTYAWVSSFWWRNFGHWHIETLSALSMIEMAGLAVTPLFPPLAPWQRTCLLLAGWGPKRYVELPDLDPVRVSRLIYPSPAWLFQGKTLDLFGIPPQLGGWVRRIASSVAARAPGRVLPRRFFIRRSAGAAINRPLDNEAEVEAVFSARGYTPIAPETMGYEDQVRLFSGAERIAGAAGAAFALLPFVAPGTHVVQLGHREGWSYAWHGWSSCFTAPRHFAYHEHPDRIAMQQGPGWKDVDHWSIDVPRMQRVLARLDAVWG